MAFCRTTFMCFTYDSFVFRIQYEQPVSTKRNFTKKEIATALTILKLRHKLTTKAISDICRLLRLCNVAKAPKSFAAVKRILKHEATDNMKADVLNICSNCNTVYKDTCNNENCQTNLVSTQSPMFLKFPIKDQIQSILASEINFSLCSQLFACHTDCLGEIQDADWYQNVFINENKSNFITLLLNVDGIAMSNTSDNSLWIFTVSCW